MTAQSQNFKVGRWQKRMSSITFEHNESNIIIKSI